MIPRTFPSIIEALQTKMVVYVLPSITGLTAWIDYIPVKGVTTESNALANTYAIDGYQVVKTIESLTGKQAWLDYIPVFESAAYNKPWSTDAGGYIPAGGLFSIASLFAAGEQGTWYDPSDLTTLFQDSAGTIPVTAVQQPVGRMLDKSGRGNHAFQTTSSSRPVLSARYNLLTATTTLATQSVTTRATTQTLRFTGTGSIVLSGTATGTYAAGTHSVVTTAGTLTLTVSGTVTDADLRASNESIGQPAYQRVNTSSDYDTVGFKPYLAFDGVDDSLVTNSIDFTATDKMAVFAGVRKLSDAAAFGVVTELSANWTINTGSFTMFAPDASAGTYGSASRGAALVAATQVATFSGAAAPDTAVIASTHDIAGDLSTIRRNGVAGTNGTGDKGTGNFGNYPLFIGRRNQATLPFNGRLYSLIVRGAASTTAQITSTETYVNQKTGAY